MSTNIDLTWMTKETVFKDTIQHTDDYVMHGRGFVIDGDIWFDEYATYFSHTKFWNDVICDHYNLPEYSGSWSDYAEQHFDERPLYWSTTGGDSFILQAPCAGLMNENRWKLLKQFLVNEFKFIEDGYITIYKSPRDSNTHTRSVLQKLKDNDDQNYHVPEWMDRYKNVSLTENNI